MMLMFQWSCGYSDGSRPLVPHGMREYGTDTGPKQNEFKSKKIILSIFAHCMNNCFCENLYCICWALTHIVRVVGTSGKQPMTHN